MVKNCRNKIDGMQFKSEPWMLEVYEDRVRKYWAKPGGSFVVESKPDNSDVMKLLKKKIPCDHTWALSFQATVNEF